METLTGIILDVSHSMKTNAGGDIDEDIGEWARAIFEVIDNFVKYDISPDNGIFTVGVGGKYGTGVFDVLKTIEEFQNSQTFTYRGGNRHIEHSRPSALGHYLTNSLSGAVLGVGSTGGFNFGSWGILNMLKQEPTPYDDLLEEFFNLVESNGAPTTRKWVSNNKIQKTIPFEKATLLLWALKSSTYFLREFVRECLPEECKMNEGDGLKRVFHGGIVTVVSTIRGATTDEILQVVESATRRLMKDVGTVYSVQRASEILHGCIDADKLNKYRSKELMKTVNPLIYGNTPMFRALKETTNIFKSSKHKKLLFVLSDGEPTDADESGIFKELKRMDVTIVSCLITSCTNIRPRKLYNVESMEWNEGAKFLFRLSSSVPSQLLPRTIFLKKGWDIDIRNNETKLFLQINHPDNIHEACNLARNVVCCQDSLSDLLGSVKLDIYINNSTQRFKAKNQVEGTCYANASAAVLHLSMKRILGRDGGYPNFYELRTKIINRYDDNDIKDKKNIEKGVSTLKVLMEITPEYRLHCKLVNANDAMKAIAAKRPVVATFCLNDSEWKQFENFYKEHPTGILTKSDIDLGNRDLQEEFTGHAVVLTSFNSECFRFMNSWGEKFADMGFFKVKHFTVLDFEFIDVFWTLNDLSEREIDYFNEYGADVADKIMKQFKGLQKAKYECPICKTISLVTDFSGSLKEAICPKCKGQFRSDKDGNILALNVYLTSLSR